MWEIPAVYDLARQICHESGIPWTDPRTGRTYPPPTTAQKEPPNEQDNRVDSGQKRQQGDTK
jgi:hypothetical protein